MRMRQRRGGDTSLVLRGPLAPSQALSGIGCSKLWRHCNRLQHAHLIDTSFESSACLIAPHARCILQLNH